MKLVKSLVAVVGATVLLGALANAASAGSFSISNQTLRATFPRVNFSGGFGTTECAITLEESFHRGTIPKVRGALIGYLTRVTIAPRCIRGSATVLTETLPEHIRYRGFTGFLPSIPRMVSDKTAVHTRIKDPTFGIECLMSGGTIGLTINREAGGVLTSVELEGSIPTSCGMNASISGTSNSLTVVGSATRLTLTLI
jgi:hypothetical protein